MHLTSVNFALQLASQSLDWANDDIRILLAESTSAITADTLNLAGAALGEVTGTGYSRLTVPARSIDSAGSGGLVRFLANPVQWGALTLGSAITRAIVYKHASVTDDSVNIPLLILDLGAIAIPAGDTFQLVWPTTGAANLQYGA